MNIEELREYCLSLKGVRESFPFGETVLVFKVGEKMFCLTNLEGPFSVSLKNEPERNVELREEYSSIIPGYHLNKKHWNTVNIDGTIPDNMIKNLIDDSYDLVTLSLSRKKQQEIKNL